MSLNKRFIAGRRLGALEVVAIDGTSVIGSFARIVPVLEQRCGPDVARFFAEPVLTSGNGAAQARVDWYSDREGPVRSPRDLDPERAAAILAKAAALTARIAPLFHDREIGAILAASFNVAGPDGLLAVGEDPVLVDWGLLPAGLAGDGPARSRHVEATLHGLLGTALVLPPLSAAEWAARFRPDGASLGSPVAHLPAPDRAPAGLGRVAPWFACLAAAILLLLSFWPGLLRFPAPQTAGVVGADVASSVLDGMRRRLANLAAAAALGCERLAVELPRLVPQRPAAVTLAPVQEGAGPLARFEPRAEVERARQAATAGGSPPAAASHDLAGRLTAATVLVIAGGSTGSGFFVTPDLVVTNRHVVEGAREVAIAGPAISVLRATEVRSDAGGELSDFALIRVAAQPGIQPLTLVWPVGALTPVVSTGFPGLQLAIDPAFGRLKAGDTAAARDLAPVFGTGVVNHMQGYPEQGATLVLHGAEIAPGSSGGPLTDYCGRVLGVNTFLRTDATLPVTARYALGSDGLAAFLRSAGVTASLATTGCDVRGSSPAPGASEVPPPAPAPASGR